MRYFIIFTGVSLFFSCTKDKTFEPTTAPVVTTVEACDTLNTDFTTVIEPIFATSCATSGCHKSGNSTGYTFETYAQISADAEIALSTIKHEVGVQPMPKFAAQLPDTTIQKIECWINKGKPQ